jgi:cyclase
LKTRQAAWKFILVLVILCSVQRSRAQSVVASDSGAKMEEVAKNVYAIIHAPATTDWQTGLTDWPHGNTGVVVGEDGVLVVDSAYLPDRARADIALIRKVTDKPIKYLINTHWHGDHTHGNAVYLKEVPGLAILGQEQNRDWIATNLERYPAVVRVGGAKQAVIDKLAKLLESGKDESGALLNDEQKRRIEQNIAQRKHELDEFKKIEIAPPSLLFSENMVVYLGATRIELHNQGRANSPADVTVFVPAANVIFTGDIVVAPLPYVGASHPLPWIEVLKKLEAMPLAAIVPGHGPVLHDHRYVSLLREFFETTRDRVRLSMTQGKNIEETTKSVDISDFKLRFQQVTGDARVGVAWSSGLTETLVERMHQCVQGYRC